MDGFLAPVGHDVPLVVVGGLHGGGDEIQGVTATHPPVRLDVSPKTVVFVTPRIPETFKLTDKIYFLDNIFLSKKLQTLVVILDCFPPRTCRSPNRKRTPTTGSGDHIHDQFRTCRF